jgi:hypothetical protein
MYVFFDGPDVVNIAIVVTDLVQVKKDIFRTHRHNVQHVAHRVQHFMQPGIHYRKTIDMACHVLQHGR